MARSNTDRTVAVAEIDQIHAALVNMISEDVPYFTGLLDCLKPDDGSPYHPAGGWEANLVAGMAFVELSRSLIAVADRLAHERGA